VPRPGYYSSLGFALPGPQTTGFGIQGADQNCPAGANTDVLDFFVPISDDGVWMFALFGFCEIDLGAVAPMGLSLRMTVASPSGITANEIIRVPAGLLVANAKLGLPFCGVLQAPNPVNRVSNLGVSLIVNPTGQAVTFKANSGGSATAWKVAD
jgi:hypothetical protein